MHRVIFNITQERKSQGHLMTGDLEPEVLDDNLLFSETLFLPLSCLPCLPLSTIKLGNQSDNSGNSFAASKHLELFHTPSGPELGGIRGKLWKMGTEFCLLCSKPKDCRGHLQHRIRIYRQEWHTFTPGGICCLALPTSPAPGIDGGAPTPQLTL